MILCIMCSLKSDVNTTHITSPHYLFIQIKTHLLTWTSALISHPALGTEYLSKLHFFCITNATKIKMCSRFLSKALLLFVVSNWELF